jgi:hypothetical protein
MNDLQFLVFLPLAGVCFLIGAGLKAIGNEILDKFIPFLCGLFGGILSVIAFKTIPNFIPADNWLMALYVGIGSGLMATGAHQVYKQFSEAAVKGVLVPINDDEVDEGEGEEIEEFEETLTEDET